MAPALPAAQFVAMDRMVEPLAWSAVPETLKRTQVEAVSTFPGAAGAPVRGAEKPFGTTILIVPVADAFAGAA
jgi:hypothetical protein